VVPKRQRKEGKAVKQVTALVEYSSYVTRGLVIYILFYAILQERAFAVAHYLLPFAYIARLIFFPKLRHEHSPLCLVIQCTDILCSLTV